MVVIINVTRTTHLGMPQIVRWMAGLGRLPLCSRHRTLNVFSRDVDFMAQDGMVEPGHVCTPSSYQAPSF